LSTHRKERKREKEFITFHSIRFKSLYVGPGRWELQEKEKIFE
jgi:hypothetical protein